MDRVLILDVEGTCTATITGKVCPNHPQDFFLLPNVYGRVQQAKKEGWLVAVASNQGGVSYGFLSEQTAWDIMLALNSMLDDALSVIKICCYHPDAPEGRRDRYVDRSKPKPAMIHEIMEDLDLPSNRVGVVGNAFSDQLAAKHAGVEFRWAHEFFMWKPHWLRADRFGYHIKDHVLARKRAMLAVQARSTRWLHCKECALVYMSEGEMFCPECRKLGTEVRLADTKFSPRVDGKL